MDLKPGDRLESKCTRCKDVLDHIIVSMLNNEIAKVECCACKSVHKYYPPTKKMETTKSKALRVRAGEERAHAVKEKMARVSKVGVAKTAKPAKQRTSEELQEKWKDAVASNPSTPIPYSLVAELELAKLVDHPSFGIGMVMETFPPDKADILFEDGIKSLRCVC